MSARNTSLKENGSSPSGVKSGVHGFGWMRRCLPDPFSQRVSFKQQNQKIFFQLFGLTPYSGSGLRGCLKARVLVSGPLVPFSSVSLIQQLLSVYGLYTGWKRIL